VAVVVDVDEEVSVVVEVFKEFFLLNSILEVKNKNQNKTF
jgi:hypothetical protein